MTVYNTDENLAPVLLSAMCTCFISHLLVLVLVLLQLVLTTTLGDLLLVIAHSSRSSSADDILLLGLKTVMPCECRNSGAGKNLSTMKSLRVLRVLRPLKTINRVPKLKVSVLTAHCFTVSVHYRLSCLLRKTHNHCRMKAPTTVLARIPARSLCNDCYKTVTILTILQEYWNRSL